MTIVNMVGGGKKEITFSFEVRKVKVPTIVPQLGFTADISGFSATSVSGMVSTGTTRYEATKAFKVKSGVLNLYDASGAVVTTTSKTITAFGTVSPYPVCKMPYGFVSSYDTKLYIVDNDFNGHIVDTEYSDIAYDGTSLWEFYMDTSGFHRKKITVDTSEWTVTLGEEETLTTSLVTSSINGWYVMAMFGPNDVQIEANLKTSSSYSQMKYDLSYADGSWKMVATTVESSSRYDSAERTGSAQEGVGYVASYGYKPARLIPGGYSNTAVSSTYGYDIYWLWDDICLYSTTMYQLTESSFVLVMDSARAYCYLSPSENWSVGGVSTHSVTWYSNGYLCYWSG